MKVIDLLNKMAKGEEVPKFWWNGCIHKIEKDYNGNCSIFDTYCKKYKRVELNQLNDEVKIIEEPKIIENIKLDSEECIEYYEDGIRKHLNTNKKDKMYVKVLNEIIDYINKEQE